MSELELFTAGQNVPLEELDLSHFMLDSADDGTARAFAAAGAPDGTLPPTTTPTIYYVNFTPEVAAEVRPQLRILKQNILDFRSWATLQTNLLVSKKIKSGRLNPNDNVAVGTYRARVMDAYFRERTTWLASSIDVNNSESLTIRSSNFHVDILRLAMKGFPIQAEILPALESILTAIVHSITSTSSQDAEKGTQYWILTTVYVYDKISQTVQPKIRTINFTTNKKTYEVTTRKSQVSETSIKMTFSGQESDFNSVIWQGVRQRILDEAIKKGQELSKDDPNWDVPV